MSLHGCNGIPTAKDACTKRDVGRIMKKTIDSKMLIGDVEEWFKRFQDRTDREPFPEGSEIWRAYYNGWIEGRMILVAELELVE